MLPRTVTERPHFLWLMLSSEACKIRSWCLSTCASGPWWMSSARVMLISKEVLALEVLAWQVRGRCLGKFARNSGVTLGTPVRGFDERSWDSISAEGLRLKGQR